MIELNWGLTSSLTARSSAAATAKATPAAASKSLLLVWKYLWLCRLDLHIDYISGHCLLSKEIHITPVMSKGGISHMLASDSGRSNHSIP